MAFAQLGAECVHLFLCFLRSAFNGGNFLTAILVIFMHISIQDSFRFFAIIKPQVSQANREETTKPSRDWWLKVFHPITPWGIIKPKP